MNIDDLADNVQEASPGEKFRDEWLADLPIGQWPSYIDESAVLVADGIFIGETELTKADFGPETGTYYRKGLAASSDIDIDETSLPIGDHSAADIGRVAWTFNRLHEEIRGSSYTDFKNPSRAIEAVINKALVESIETGEIAADDIETIRLPESATISTLVSEVFCRPRSETYVDLLVDTVKKSATSGLLDHLDEPRMVTPLWEHQSEALDAWLSHDCRGYVDMATATGKTVLGLAAVAHHFGALHPHDREISVRRHRPSENSRSTVVVIAHRELILDQWKREFDIHLNIPEQRSTQSGEHTVQFEWGDVHFWTPKRLQEEGVPDTDLVILDETHHYLGSSGFGSILDNIDGHVLALSGSVDEANARSLERRSIPQLFEFSLRDGQKAGVIPQCNWDVVLTPYENQLQLADVTDRCRQGLQQYANGVDIPGNADIENADLSFETFSEARSLVQSTAGRELKKHDSEFREFASAIMARQMTQYNLSPSLSTVVNLTLDHIDQHKCVVLLESGDEIESVTDELNSQLGDAYSSLVTVFDDETDLTTVESFDEEQDNGALIGLATTLGEGIDIQTADVCINRGRGRLSRSLIQRMGRILRNPDGDKYAQFFHVSGVPTQDEALLVDEDGITFLETASQLLSWGEKFNARPVFDIDIESTITDQNIETLEQAGASAIDDRSPDRYEWPSDQNVRDALKTLCDTIHDQQGSTLLSLERQEQEAPEQIDSQDRDSVADSESNEGVQFVSADGAEVEVAGWLAELADTATEDESLDEFVRECVRSYLQKTLTFPEDGAVPDSGTNRKIPLNPALDAMLSAYSDSGSETAAVHAAIATRILNEFESVIDRRDARSEIRNQLQSIVHDE